MSAVGPTTAKGTATSGYVQKNLGLKRKNNEFIPITVKKIAIDPKITEHDEKRRLLLLKMNAKGPKIHQQVHLTTNDLKNKEMERLAGALGIDRDNHIEGKSFERMRKLEKEHIVDYSSSSEEESDPVESSESGESSDSESDQADFQLESKFEKAQVLESIETIKANELREKLMATKKKTSDLLRQRMMEKKALIENRRQHMD